MTAVLSNRAHSLYLNDLQQRRICCLEFRKVIKFAPSPSSKFPQAARSRYPPQSYDRGRMMSLGAADRVPLALLGKFSGKEDHCLPSPRRGQGGRSPGEGPGPCRRLTTYPKIGAAGFVFHLVKSTINTTFLSNVSNLLNLCLDYVFPRSGSFVNFLVFGGRRALRSGCPFHLAVADPGRSPHSKEPPQSLTAPLTAQSIIPYLR